MTAAAKPRNPLVDVLVTIVVPALILMRFSGEQHLGSAGALLVALAFPLAWGGWDLVARRKYNPFAIIGLVSILLTGGIGLLHLDARWLAVKEAAVPGLIGLAVLISTRTRYPLIRVLLYNPAILDVNRVAEQLEQRGKTAEFDARLHLATLLVAGTFFFSSFMNYVLARWIVTSPAGTTAFNEELGTLTLLSYPMIAVPSMIMMIAVFFWLGRGIKRLTGLSFLDLIGDNRSRPG